MDLVTDENVTFDPRSVDEIADCMLKAVNGESGNSIEENYQRLQKYDLKNVMEKMKVIYSSLTGREFQ